MKQDSRSTTISELVELITKGNAHVTFEEAVAEIWQNTLNEITSDRNVFLTFLQDEENDLFKPFEWGHGQNLFQEAVLIAYNNIRNAVNSV